MGILESRLERVHALAKGYVDRGALPGYACIVSSGNDVWFRAYGMRDVEDALPVRRDTIFRIYSMTKPITSVALMMLYEEGRFQLDDPVARYIPSWENLAVFEDGDEDSYSTTAPERPMIVKDLLMHTSGLTYGFMHSHSVDAIYRKRGIGGGDLQRMVDALAEIPLRFSPGTRWSYSHATDVCGYLVQLLSDTDLDVFVRERITEPLEMVDSAFWVPPAGLERFAACYQYLEDGRFARAGDSETRPYRSRPAFLSGGGGMVGTIDDYHRFAKMLLGRGELEGARLLGRKTVEYMTSNQLPGNRDLAGMGQRVFSETSFEGVGFGLGFSVVLDPAAANVLDSPGDFGWGGAASTYFWVDPQEQLVVVFMTQLRPSSSYPIRRELKTAVYQALVD